VSASGGEYSIVGGIVGEMNNNSIVSGSYNEGTISAAFAVRAEIGGIAGDVYESAVSNSYNKGKVFTDTAEYWASAGGIAGNLYYDSEISASYNTGEISAKTMGEPPPCTYNCYNYIARSGGIAGDMSYGEISNSYNIGDISAHSLYSSASAGGIAGDGRIVINGSYNIGDISAIAPSRDAYAGGIAGSYSWSNEEPPTALKNSAAINSMISAAGTTVHIGRVTGDISGNGVTNNFAYSSMFLNGSTAIIYNAKHGVEKNLTMLKTKSTYQGAINGDGQGGLGWKFGNNAANPWVWGKFTNYAYPTLWWQTEKP
jgi:hypothetical protein